MNEFTKRTLTGAVYVALTLGAALAGKFTTFILFLPVCVIAAREWHRLYQLSGNTSSEHIAMALGGLSYSALAIPVLTEYPALLMAGLAVVLCALVIVAFVLMRRGDADPARAFAGHLGTVLYVAVPFVCAVLMVQLQWRIFLGFMFLLWTSDTGAYLVGRSIGRTKLMPSVSPGKTWEGLAGGVALTMLVGWLLARYWTVLPLHTWLIAAAVVAITATLGDLLESAFKRARGVKDSGTILPGHGGILDRFDGYLLSAPAMVIVSLL